jgi:small subunit ribosomal protein S1
VRILEVDAERRRLSLSLKRVEDGMPVQPAPGEDAPPPALDLSEDVFADETLPDPESSAAVDDVPTTDEPAEGSDEAAPASDEE